MIFEAFIWHKLVDQQPLDPSLSIYRAISNEFYKICVLNNSKKLNFCLPLFMTLKTKEKNYIHKTIIETTGLQVTNQATTHSTLCTKE